MAEIDPQEFGRFQAEVTNLRRDVDRMVVILDRIESTLNEAKGGWKVLMLVGGASATVGAFAHKLLELWMKG